MNYYELNLSEILLLLREELHLHVFTYAYSVITQQEEFLKVKVNNLSNN